MLMEGNNVLICFRIEKCVMATDLWSVGWRGRKENFNTYSLISLGLEDVVLSVVVVCTLASSSSMSDRSAFLLFWDGIVVIGGAG